MTAVAMARPGRFGRRLAGCLLLAALVTAACGGEDGLTLQSGTREAAETAVPATPTPLPPPTQSNPFRGLAVVNDPAGDVDGTGETPAGIDLTGARIVPSEGQLVMIWYTSETAEIQVDAGATATWTFELAHGDQPVYDVTFQVAGKEWDILVLDHETGEETKHRIGSIYADRLDVPYPATRLDKLQPTFTWSARSRYTDASGATWTDTAPDSGRSAFPN